MITAVIFAICSYALYYLYDYLNVVHPELTFARFLFPIGTVLVVLSTALLLLDSHDSFIGGIAGVISLLGAVISFGLTLWALVFSLPKDTYAEPGERRPVYEGGAYSLCRHPGVFFYCIFYLFLLISFPNMSTFVGFSTLCIGNVGYMIIQDVWTFPKLLQGYNEYKLRSNLFIPTFKYRK